MRIQDYADTLRGYRVLHLVGKGNKPATMPVTVPVLRVLEACRGQRATGPLVLRPVSGQPIDLSLRELPCFQHARMFVLRTPSERSLSIILTALKITDAKRDVTYHSMGLGIVCSIGATHCPIIKYALSVIRPTELNVVGRLGVLLSS